MKQETRKRLHLISTVLFIFYLIGISYFLFFSERYGRTEGSDGYRYNLVLFREIKRFLKYRRHLGLESFIVNIFGNILAFTPFGFCLPLVGSRDKGFFRVLLWTFLFSLSIETIQLLYQIGIFDVDDLILNTLGGILGYLLYRMVAFVYKIIRKL